MKFRFSQKLVVDSDAEPVKKLRTDEDRKRHREYCRRWRRTHPEYRENSKKTHREWRRNHPEKSGEYSKSWYYKYREELAKKNKEYAAKFPERIYAKNLARKIPLGSKCELCPETDIRTENLEHHHPDYDEPLITVTVCGSCHKYIRQKVKCDEVSV